MKNPIKSIKKKVDNTFNEKEIERDVEEGVIENSSIIWFLRQIGASIRHLGSLFIDSIGSLNEENKKKRQKRK